MKEIPIILNKPSTFLMLLAPPAWGKTTLLIEMYLNNNFKIIYLSPLRALAEEFYCRCAHINGVYKPNTKKECGELIKIFSQKEKYLLISTCEQFDDRLFHFGKSDQKKIIFIFDEIHLFYYWGETFRDILWETFMGACNSGASVMGLTATIDKILLPKVKKDLHLSMENIYFLNLGNQRLKHYPCKNHYYYFRKQLVRRFIFEVLKKKKGTVLFFCRYRSSVESWVNYSKKMKINAIGCVGGEAKEFIKSLKENPNPDCIFATSVLGHGVNLPEISKVFIDYKELNKDFYLQMVGRGGRNGEYFEIFGFNNDLFISKKEELYSFIKSSLFDMLYLKVREYFGYGNKG